MKLIARYQPVRSYVDNLCAEIKLAAEQMPARMKVAHLHFGGGTPTAIHPDDLEKIVRTIEAHFTFVDGAERAIETDPRTITDEMITRIGARSASPAQAWAFKNSILPCRPPSTESNRQHLFKRPRRNCAPLA